MSKKDKTLIYVAETSKVLAKIISTELEKQGFEVCSFDDGFSLLKQIVEKSPDLIITDKYLNTFNGTEICNVLKNGSAKSDIPVILISTEEKPVDFWTNANLANKTISISGENIETLVAAVKELLGQNFVRIDTFFSDDDKKRDADKKASSDEQIATWMVNTINKSDYLFTMSKNVMQLYKDVKDLELLVGNLFRLLYKACEYDAPCRHSGFHPQ